MSAEIESLKTEYADVVINGGQYTPQGLRLKEQLLTAGLSLDEIGLLGAIEQTEATPGTWSVKRNHAAGDPPQYDTFTVVAPNPDAGKEGVSYAGEHFSVAQCLGNEFDAYLFAASKEMAEMLQEVLDFSYLPLSAYCRKYPNSEVTELDLHGRITALLAKARREQDEKPKPV